MQDGSVIMVCTVHNRMSVCVCVDIMNVCICDMMSAGVCSQCLLAGLFSWLPMGRDVTWGICCPLPGFCPSVTSFICAHDLLLPHTHTHAHIHTYISSDQFSLDLWRKTTDVESNDKNTKGDFHALGAPLKLNVGTLAYLHFAFR